tara:strand:+ start:2152 stop:2325 length:174 start_codon:yes stop_codon:yes gene_type:complete
MRATVSNSESGKIQVFTTKELKGRGVKNMGLKSNGETRYLLTQTAYDKISNDCEWIG